MLKLLFSDSSSTCDGPIHPTTTSLPMTFVFNVFSSHFPSWCYFSKKDKKNRKKNLWHHFSQHIEIAIYFRRGFSCAPNRFFFFYFQSRSCRILTDARSRHTTITDLLFYYFWLSRAAGRAGIARVSDSDTCDAGCITSRRATLMLMQRLSEI